MDKLSRAKLLLVSTSRLGERSLPSIRVPASSNVSVDIGRNITCKIQDPRISKQHVCVAALDSSDGITVKQLGRNSCKVANAKLKQGQEVTLTVGDTLSLIASDPEAYQYKLCIMHNEQSGNGPQCGVGSNQLAATEETQAVKKETTKVQKRQAASAWDFLSGPSKRSKQESGVSSKEGSKVLRFNDKSLSINLPRGWESYCNNKVLYRSFPSSSGVDPSGHSKVAGFDFDNCLCLDHRVAPKHGDKSIKKLKQLSDDGFALVIFTNESLERFVKAKAVTDRIEKKCSRLSEFVDGCIRAKGYQMPIQVFVAVRGGKGIDDKYRKPNSGMYDLFSESFNGTSAISLEKSFFVGDAAGRPGDHSNADKGFATGAGMEFYTDDAFFA